jgi:hypothetical protein
MSVIINLKPELEAGLLAQARACGMTLDAYLLSMVERAVLPASQKSLTPEQRAAEFEAWSANHRATSPLSDPAVSREAMYKGRDS